MIELRQGDRAALGSPGAVTGLTPASQAQEGSGRVPPAAEHVSPHPDQLGSRVISSGMCLAHRCQGHQAGGQLRHAGHGGGLRAPHRPHRAGWCLWPRGQLLHSCQRPHGPADRGHPGGATPRPEPCVQCACLECCGGVKWRAPRSCMQHKPGSGLSVMGLLPEAGPCCWVLCRPVPVQHAAVIMPSWLGCCGTPSVSTAVCAAGRSG